MKPTERQDWIESYIRALPPRSTVDICDSEFVYAYIDATGAKHRIRLWGAPACPQLSRDLTAMKYRLRRSRTGIQGMGGMGFPTWVWSYRI